MALTPAMEDYLEAVFMLQRQNGYVRCVDVAEQLGVKKPSYVESNTSADKIFKFVAVILESLPLFIFDILRYNTLFPGFHVQRYQIINPADFQFSFFVVFRSINRVIIVNFILNFSYRLDIFCFKIGIDSIGQSAYQQIFAE